MEQAPVNESSPDPLAVPDDVMELDTVPIDEEEDVIGPFTDATDAEALLSLSSGNDMEAEDGATMLSLLLVEEESVSHGRVVRPAHRYVHCVGTHPHYACLLGKRVSDTFEYGPPQDLHRGRVLAMFGATAPDLVTQERWATEVDDMLRQGIAFLVRSEDEAALKMLDHSRLRQLAASLSPHLELAGPSGGLSLGPQLLLSAPPTL